MTAGRTESLHITPSHRAPVENGYSMVGEIVEVGADAEGFSVGEGVFLSVSPRSAACGRSSCQRLPAPCAGRVLTYEHLLRRVWRLEPDADVRPMRTAISSLRRKLGDDAQDPTYIFTELRVGYRMPKGETQGGEEG